VDIQTYRQTDKQTDTTECPAQAGGYTAGVGKERYLHNTKSNEYKACKLLSLTVKCKLKLAWLFQGLQL